MTINPENYRIPDAPAKAVPHGTALPPFVSDIEYRDILLKMLQAGDNDPAQQFSIKQLEAEVIDQGLKLPIVRHVE